VLWRWIVCLYNREDETTANMHAAHLALCFHAQLIVSHTLLNTPAAPSVEFKFVDGTEKYFDSQSFTAREMMDEVLLNAMQMDTQWELDEKNIDDV